MTLANALDYETRTSHTFTVTAEAGGETQSESFTLNVSDITVGLNVFAATGQNITSGAGGAQYNLGEFSPVGTVVSNANSGGMSGVTYALLKQEPNPLVIDSTTGQVTLGSALDYETASIFRYRVTATKDGETTTSGNIVYQVNDESYTVTDSGSPSKRIMSVDGDISNDASITYHFTETGPGSGDDFIIANLGQGLPAGTTYSSSNNTSSGLAVSSDGRVTAPFPNVFEVNSTNGCLLYTSPSPRDIS